MKFNYEYRTRDNVRHEGVVVASDRESAYSVLKKQGIRPGRLTEAPGFVNKIVGKGKRWMAIFALTAFCCVLVVMLMREARSSMDLSVKAPRHQIYGDPAILQDIQINYTNYFSRPIERLMFHYAIPGRMPQVSVSQRLNIEAKDFDLLVIDEADPIEVREYKRVLNGMKDELRDFLNKGGSSIGYIRALGQRQLEEFQIRNRVKQELTQGARPEVWATRNKRLRELGIETIPVPEESVDSQGL